ncbi:hypothetical protein W02_13630 [Nitrospira sp. KM1]|uniref:thiol-disulfide oxidoreductase DCC family protein n=1 Tax=Nitrospira sp. KM1 TaxID=1936990 RepID=UPI0013A766DE|nr:DUF393 domain-containing protein [Nitrospira sp. KM1]BCA54223.1 hypothetical protein W02_13630 [Nitrospira sp. KM1]
MLEVVHVIYDGQCLFCIRSLRLFRAVDFFGAFRYHDAHQTEHITVTFPELRDADFDNAMFVVTGRRLVYRGFYAFRRMIWSTPLTWLLIPLFYFPGAAYVGARVYAWVAKNRLKFGCQSDACALPTLQGKDSSR